MDAFQSPIPQYVLGSLLTIATIGTVPYNENYYE